MEVDSEKTLAGPTELQNITVSPRLVRSKNKQYHNKGIFWVLCFRKITV